MITHFYFLWQLILLERLHRSKKRKKKLKYPSRVFQFLEQKHIGEKLSINESLFAESGKK
jgi:hypothetical protein